MTPPTSTCGSDNAAEATTAAQNVRLEKSPIERAIERVGSRANAATLSVTPQHAACEPPTELRNLKGWLVWRLEQKKGEPKPRKVPYYVSGRRRSGTQGSPEDRAKLTTFAAAQAAASRSGMDGVGLAMMPDWSFAVLDFDNCVDPSGELLPEVVDIASRTYSEYSPSGKGIHTFVRGNYGDRKSPSRGNEFGFETFSNHGFLTFTGNILPQVKLSGNQDTISSLNGPVSALCAKRFSPSAGAARRCAKPLSASTAPAVLEGDFMVGREPPLGLPPERMNELIKGLDPNMGRGDWIRVGMALHHETQGDETGLDLWDV